MSSNVILRLFTIPISTFGVSPSLFLAVPALHNQFYNQSAALDSVFIFELWPSFFCPFSSFVHQKNRSFLARLCVAIAAAACFCQRLCDWRRSGASIRFRSNALHLPPYYGGALAYSRKLLARRSNPLQRLHFKKSKKTSL